jgi:flavin reductase (DIM6/NTAB) family NADH-FMN oxidoreductase RutF
MNVVGFDVYWEDNFARQHGICRAERLDELLRSADVITLHTNLTPETHHLINSGNIGLLKPGVVIVNCARRATVSKDTARNAVATGGFVLNVVSEDLAEIVHKTSAYYPSDISETVTLGIELAPSRRVAPPRIAAAPINLECKLLQILEFGEERDQNLVGEVVYFHIRDSIYADGKIDQTKLRPLARLGGPTYARLGEFITMPVDMSTDQRLRSRR